MDKLNKLLEEYPNGKGDIDSLKFLRGFIKWLVDNDKIDRDKVGETEKKQIVRIQRTIESIKILRYTTLLMLLAISDTPIDVLVSYLR